MQDATAKKMLCFIFFNDKTLTSEILTVARRFPHGTLRGFPMESFAVSPEFHTTNTPCIDVEMLAPAKKNIQYDL